MDQIIRITKNFDIHIEKAFDFFTIKENLELWLTKKADVELREGGKYELFWSPETSDPTNNSTYGCKILAFEKPFYLNVEWKGNANQKNFMNTVRPLTNVTLIFSEIGAEKTRITLLHTGWRTGSDWDTARKYFINAWTGAFQALERAVKGLSN